MKSLVLISLLVLICSKNSVIEYGKEYTFDKSNNQFEFTAEQKGLAFIHISYEGSLNLRYVFTILIQVKMPLFRNQGWGGFTK